MTKIELRGDSPYNLKSNRNNAKQNRENILIVGSSVLKGIDPSKLKEGVDVWTHRGANVLDIYNDIKNNIDVSSYHTVVIHVGGNDASCRKDERQFISIYKDIIKYLKGLECRVVVSGILPRHERDVSYFNDLLQKLCRDEHITYISHDRVFLSNDNLARNLYLSDLIHLNNFGTIRLLRNVNRFVNIFNSVSGYNFRDSNRSIP